MNEKETLRLYLIIGRAANMNNNILDANPKK
jgi:hypothetical protein